MVSMRRVATAPVGRPARAGANCGRPRPGSDGIPARRPATQPAQSERPPEETRTTAQDWAARPA